MELQKWIDKGYEIIVDFGPYKHEHIQVMNNLDIQMIKDSSVCQ